MLIINYKSIYVTQSLNKYKTGDFMSIKRKRKILSKSVKSLAEVNKENEKLEKNIECRLVRNFWNIFT